MLLKKDCMVVSPLARVMLIMPELQELEPRELCGESVPPLSMLVQEVDLLGSSSVASTPQSLEPGLTLGFVDSEVLFAKELSGLLISLEVTIPRCGKEIACLLSGKDTGDTIKKVREYLRSKSKKSGATRKVCATA
jgi:hypothetical protein